MIENTILSHLVFNEPFARRVLPFLKPEYFHNGADKLTFELINEFINKYNNSPTREALLIELDKKENLPEAVFKSVKDYVKGLSCEATPMEWLVENTEKFCQDKAVYNAVMEAIQILDGKTNMARGAIPEVLTKALAVSFDTQIGHDYFEGAQARFELYNRKEWKIPTGIHYIDLITNGGFSRKTLNLLLAPTGVGKSLWMCNFAANNLMAGKNVLYITLEMAEEEIAKRIDANLLNVTMDDIDRLSNKQYSDKINRMKEQTVGKLVIKEYPTASVSVVHFKQLLHELKLKKNFVPDIIYLDYLNLCASSRLKADTSSNSYLYVKAIAEEVRGFAQAFNLPVVSATQTNRGGLNSTDIDMDDTSDSFGVPMTLDFFLALITSEELEQLNQFMCKQLKNRYRDKNRNKRFVVGIDRPKMRLYDVEQDAQTDIQDSGEEAPVFDNSTFHALEAEREKRERFKTLFE